MIWTHGKKQEINKESNRNLTLSFSKPLDFSDPSRAIESWGRGFLDSSRAYKLPSMQQAGFDFFDANIE